MAYQYHGKSRAMLNQATQRARKELKDEYEELMNRNADMASGSFWGGLGGSLALGALAAFSGGTLVPVALATGLGQRLGAEFGEHAAGDFEGGIVEEYDAGTGYGTGEYGERLEQSVSDTYEGFDTKQHMDAVRSAGTAFIAGGGIGAAKESAQFFQDPLFANVPSWKKAMAIGLDVAQAPYVFDPLGTLAHGSTVWDQYRYGAERYEREQGE